MASVPKSLTLDLQCDKGRMSYAVPLSPFVRHINDLWGCKCLADMHILGLFPNVKELTESNAAYMAVRRFLRGRFALDDSSVAVVVVGDGHTPRTGALFAFRSAWTAYSVDPALRDRQWGVRRLFTIRKTIEDAGILEAAELNGPPPKVIIVGVHPHASLASTLKHVPGVDRAVVWIPCCKKVDIEAPPDVDYVDPGIWSPKNRVMVWERL